MPFGLSVFLVEIPLVIISLIVGLFGGVSAMLKFLFWSNIVIFGIILAIVIIVIVIGGVLGGVLALLNACFEKITKGHAAVIWIPLIIVLLVLVVNFLHNCLV